MLLRVIVGVFFHRYKLCIQTYRNIYVEGDKYNDM